MLPSSTVGFRLSLSLKDAAAERRVEERSRTPKSPRGREGRIVGNAVLQVKTEGEWKRNEKGQIAWCSSAQRAPFLYDACPRNQTHKQLTHPRTTALAAFHSGRRAANHSDDERNRIPMRTSEDRNESITNPLHLADASSGKQMVADMP